ncbi:DUF3861 domain-containing protein [Vibrio sp. F74]|uniref:DUF3861 domain-containing protein n=1 Tax=Vibrio sp. F74 TaxID=700020 RepID=UPI0035F5EA34
MIPKIRKDRCYRITVEEVNSDHETIETLQLELEDRENLFKVVETLKKSSGLEENEATKIGVALRLLGPVMIKNGKHPLFVNFRPHFKTFMQDLKSTVKSAGKEG